MEKIIHFFTKESDWLVVSINGTQKVFTVYFWLILLLVSVLLLYAVVFLILDFKNERQLRRCLLTAIEQRRAFHYERSNKNRTFIIMLFSLAVLAAHFTSVNYGIMVAVSLVCIGLTFMLFLRELKNLKSEHKQLKAMIV